MRVAEQLQRCLTNPDWLPFKLDLAGQKILLVNLKASHVREAAFLDERALRPDSEGFWVALHDFEQIIAPPPTASALFHVGHCGSTLLSRLLGEAGGVRALREPLVMREIALGKAQGLSAADPWFRVLWGWLSRSEQGPVNIKLTSACANLLPWFLRLGEPATALYVDLETYLTSASRGGGAGNDIAAFAQQRELEWKQLYPDAPTPAQPAELAAAGWAVCMTHFSQAQQHRPDQLMLLNFDDWLSDIDGATSSLMRHHGFAKTFDDVASIPLLGQYAKKTDVPYDAQARQADLALARSRNGQFVEDGLAWLSRLPSGAQLKPYLTRKS